MHPVTAKQFIIARVLSEADAEQVTLSEVEKKMLQFTEVGPSLPDIYEVQAEFERDCDSDEYEAKIAGLLRRARERDEQGSGRDQDWKDALDALKDEDHYLLVMAYGAFPEYRKLILPTHRLRDYAIYVAIAIALVLSLIGISVWVNK